MVSEFMLQQTQVKTVLPYFQRFIAKFPDVQALAEADEQEVLKAWQGLGYYSRARNLRRAAGEICDRFERRVPGTVEELRSLPGIGRYTAGAIASLAHDAAAPIVDGNVARVICRLDLIRENPKEKNAVELLWRRAEELVPQKQAGDFNSALMELGATVCTPRNPSCLVCPVRKHCAAAEAGMQDKIPQVREKRSVPTVRRVVIGLQKGDQWLIEQRPANGRWASMWQFPTFPWPLKLNGANRKALRKIGSVRHALTHRRYVFTAYHCAGKIELPAAENRRWVTAKKLMEYPMSKPQGELGKLLGLNL
jgi:A/G-specific adenine glycosylase